jgi:MFS family permease
MTTSLWRNRDYLMLRGSQSVSGIGSQVSTLAFLLLILALTHSPAQAGLAGALAVLPFAVLGLPAGTLVDRWNRKRLMILCDAGRTLALVSIPLAAVLGIQQADGGPSTFESEREVQAHTRLADTTFSAPDREDAPSGRRERHRGRW